MPFECCQCGECCRNLGLVFIVREDRRDGSFLVRNRHTGEETTAIVDPDKRDLFGDTRIFSEFPHACPFFRCQPGTAKACCTVHRTRPEICREYQCWRLLIVDRRGRWAGKIRYSRSLVSEDPFLRRIWTEGIEDLAEPDDRIWEATMVRTLMRAGYSVRK